MTAVTKVIVNNARGPRGLASGPLGAGSVDADTITDDTGEKAAIADKLGVVPASDLAAGTVDKGSALVGLNQTLAYPEDSIGAYFTRRLVATAGPFNAKGDGSANDLAALNTWAAEAGPGTELILPGGVYNINAAMAPIITKDVLITGPGVIRYVGASPSPGHLVTIGDGVTTYDNIRILGPRIDSATLLSAGSALRIRKGRMVHLDIHIDGDDENTVSKCYDGLWLDSATLTYLNHSRFTAQQDSIKWGGGIGLHMNSAFTKGHGTTDSNGTGIGLHLTGGCADLNTENWSQLLNETGVRVDNSASSDPNHQLFFNEGTKLDSNKTHGILLNDATAGSISKLIKVNCWIASSRGPSGAGLVIAADGWKNGRIDVASARLFNHASSAIYSADPTVALNVGSDAVISDNDGYGIDATAPWSINCLARMFNNDNGNFSSNVSVFNDVAGVLRLEGGYQKPFRLGTGYLWVDGSGRLRIHSSAPGSDTAGSIVGTQS